MQQSPFPIAHSNQGFQGRWADNSYPIDVWSSRHSLWFLWYPSAGMDASAQTGSHELTIPNDVSHEDCSSSLIFFFSPPPVVPGTSHLFSSPSSSAASLVARVQRSTRSARCRAPRSRSPTPWRAPPTDRSPSLALTPASVWPSTWSTPGKMKTVTIEQPFLSVSDPLLNVTVDLVPLRLSSEATGLAANWRRGSSSAPNVTTTATQHPHFLSRGPLLNLMQKQSTRNSPFSPRLCL